MNIYWQCNVNYHNKALFLENYWNKIHESPKNYYLMLQASVLIHNELILNDSVSIWDDTNAVETINQSALLRI